MSGDSWPPSLPPFPEGYRASGMLLHVTSLPSPYAVGDVGPAALDWVHRLHQAGQRRWQALPLGPTGYGNSLYQLQSSFAGNVLLISPDWLIADGLLRGSDVDRRPGSSTAVDYDAVIPFKHRMLDVAWANFCAGASPDPRGHFAEFCAEHAHWLDDYALFRALKMRCEGRHYLEWPVELVERVPAALARARRELTSLVDQVRFAQFPPVPPSGAPRGACSCQRRPVDRRSPVLRLPRLERRVGESGTVSAGRASPAALRRRRASRRLQRRGTALGKSRLRLERASANWVPFVHRPSARPAFPRRCDSPRSFPGSPLPGTYRRTRRQPDPASGYLGPAPRSSAP
jgi:hypothetical protein